MNLSTIVMEIESYDDTISTLVTTGFIFSQKDKKYIVSVHHDMPIKYKNIKVTIDSLTFYTHVIHRPIWNELVVLDFPDTIDYELSIYCKGYKTSLNKDDKLHAPYISKIKYRELTQLPYYGFPWDYCSLYYKILFTDDCDKNKSGMPIYDDKKRLVGIFSKRENNIGYVIPSIYLQKTFERTDNDNIYIIEDKNITKVNNYNVNEKRKIYHPSLRDYIDLVCYFLLEGDKDKKELIITEKKMQFVDYKIFTNILKPNFSTKIYIKDDSIKVNFSLITLLKSNNKTKKVFTLLRLMFKENTDMIKLTDFNRIISS